MKTFIVAISIGLLAGASFAQGGMVPDRGNEPCVRVTIQNERTNESDVQQHCDRNASRTVQVGARNHAQTLQTGTVNSNGVRQYHFDRDQYFPNRRHP
jgi:hypothetical protein